MSPSRPVRNIKVQVSRHNTQRIGPALTAQVEALAREQGIRTDIRQPTNDSSSTIALAIENASDWNSMLSTARAERGPQWDVGTQQFLVDEHSDLYYDHTPLLGYLNEGVSEDPSQSPQATHAGLTTPRVSHRGQPPNMGGQFPMNGVSPMASAPRHAMSGNMGPSYPAGSFAPVPPNQFYGGSSRSPMMTRGMSMDGIGISPDVRRRV
ncbi:hypothetical protein OF83DRAFT_1093162 [Amylostereum chailletii]|nr:hypothetical protein OF83DRAFT_1093162 [Amylostereum chailletii]